MYTKVGIDSVEIERFKTILEEGRQPFLGKVFFDSEVKYCSSYVDYAPHFAGTFAAKEAVSKALGTARYPFSDIEIRRKEDGAPYACYKDSSLPVAISITHTKDTATAIAIG